MTGTVDKCKRVAFMLADLKLGGAERFTLNLACGLSQRGVQVDLVLVSATGQYMSEVPSDVNIVDLRSSRAISCLPRLVRYLRGERPDVMVTAQDHVSVTALLAKRFAGVKTRVVVTEHSMTSLEAATGGSRKRVITPRLMRMLYPSAGGIIAVSENVRTHLLKALSKPTLDVKVVCNGVITPEFLQSLSEPLDHPWFSDGQPPVVLAAGRLTAVKDYPTLLRAFALVRRRTDVRLVILGEGEEGPKLTSLAEELGIEADVQLPGFVPNPGPYMAKSGVFVLSSLWESLPTVAIESLAAGTPVVATDCRGGIREILGSGPCARLVPVGDHEAMAAAINDVLAAPREEIPEESWKKFTLSAMVERYLEVLQLNAQ